MLRPTMCTWVILQDISEVISTVLQSFMVPDGTIDPGTAHIIIPGRGHGDSDSYTIPGMDGTSTGDITMDFFT